MLSARLKSEVEKKSGKVVSLHQAWMHATEQAVVSGLDERSVVFILNSFEAVSSLLKLTESTGKVGPPDQLSFVERVEQCSAETSYSTDEWLMGLERTLQFLIKQNRSSTLDLLLGYLSCAAGELSASSGPLTLADGVDAFLQEFGFEG